MTGFEPGSSGIVSDHPVNCATTTALWDIANLCGNAVAHGAYAVYYGKSEWAFTIVGTKFNRIGHFVNDVQSNKQNFPWEVVVAQLVERLLTIPEVRCSNPVISKNLFIKLNICLLSTVYWKDKNKEKVAGNGPFFKKSTWLLDSFTKVTLIFISIVQNINLVQFRKCIT